MINDKTLSLLVPAVCLHPPNVAEQHARGRQSTCSTSEFAQKLRGRTSMTMCVWRRAVRRPVACEMHLARPHADSAWCLLREEAHLTQMVTVPQALGCTVHARINIMRLHTQGVPASLASDHGNVAHPAPTSWNAAERLLLLRLLLLSLVLLLYDPLVDPPAIGGEVLLGLVLLAIRLDRLAGSLRGQLARWEQGAIIAAVLQELMLHGQRLLDRYNNLSHGTARVL
mmetsp:Transcript_43785/g.115052  ORF Transcript_43785/g.115052 Transcript_43785/m.115052 type:complete len:227 (-) Transcript_43785:37-717(-)